MLCIGPMTRGKVASYLAIVSLTFCHFFALKKKRLFAVFWTVDDRFRWRQK